MIDTITDSPLMYLRVYAGFAVTLPDGGSRLLPREHRDHRYAGWAAAFDDADLADFAEALRRGLDAAENTVHTEAVESLVDGWRALARLITDPQRDAVIIGPGTPSHRRFVDTDLAPW